MISGYVAEGQLAEAILRVTEEVRSRVSGEYEIKYADSEKILVVLKR